MSIRFLLAYSLLPPTSSAAPDFKLQLFPADYAKERGAQCLDHSPAGYYIREQDPNKWVVFLEGGGLCVELIDCIARLKSSQGSSTKFLWNQTPQEHFSTSISPLNPLANFSHVYVPYCSGDTWLGTSAKGHASLLGMQMSGHLIMEAVVESLLNTTQLGTATDVILSGTSAGGIGTYHHADWLADILATYAKNGNHAPPRVTGFPIEGTFFPEKWPVLFEQFIIGNHDPVANFMSQYLALLQDPWFPPACVEAAKKEGFARGDCFDVSRMIYYTKTPFFIGMNRFDSLLIQGLGLCLTCKGKDNADGLNGKFIRFYGSRMNETVIDINSSLPQTGWFVPSEFHHDENFCQFFNTTEKKIQGVSLRAAFEAWYYDRRPTVLVEPMCHSDGPCDPPTDCLALGGNYTATRWAENVSVVQHGCDLDVTFGGKSLSGNVFAATVTVATFHSSGTIQGDGSVKFPDGGLWVKQDPGASCHFVGGKYYDKKWSKDVVVVQAGCKLNVDYGAESLTGNVIDKTVAVKSFKTVGNVQNSGDIDFWDGGVWTKQQGTEDVTLVV